MASMDDAARVALGLPGVEEGQRRGGRAWLVGTKGFAWERPFTKADLKRFGDAPAPDGPILAVTVEDLGEKEAVLQANPGGFFTIAHFEGYPAVLIQLNAVTQAALEEAIIDGWLCCAPPALVAQYLERQAGT